MSGPGAGFTLLVLIFWIVAIVLFFSGEYGYWVVVGIIGIVLTIVWWTQVDRSGENQTDSSPKKYSLSSILSESDLQNNFANFSWRKMEELTGELFTKKGYSVEVTKSTGDFGIDVWAKKDDMLIGIQVKKWKNDVGFDNVTKTLGSNLGKANKFILISTISFFTPQAWRHQQQHSHLIELWDTNRFKKELRDNFFTETKPTKHMISHHDDKIDSFDYDAGFNIDEVYDSPKIPPPELSQQCTKCGSPVFRDFCGNCGKEVNSPVDIQNRIIYDNLDKICHNCEYANDKESRLCGKCGRLL